MNELIFFAVGQGAAQPSCVQAALPLLLMFAVFYFLLIRPQQKRQRQLQAMLSRLKKGDKVVTGGGLIGTISEVTDAELEILIADKVRVRVVRSQVQLYGAELAALAEKKDEK